MKKLFLVSAIILSLGSMAPVFAANITEEGDQTGTMEITYGVNSGYTVTIPATFNLTNTDPVEKVISAQDVRIAYGQSLKVSISSENFSESKWYMVDNAASSNKIEYTIKDGENAVADEGVVLEVLAGAENLSGSNTLTFQVPEVPTRAGTYKDTLTFSVSVGAPTVAVSLD